MVRAKAGRKIRLKRTKKTRFGRPLSRVRGRRARWGATPEKLDRIPSGEYVDITNTPGYEHLRKKGYRTMAILLSSGYPSAKHIYYVPKRKPKKHRK